jgi:ligand-binding sensor domain-containing protein/two-component sensor histidine kinase
MLDTHRENRRSITTLPTSIRLYMAFVCLALAPLATPATERVYRLYDQSSGLPVSQVNWLAQDREGFFWLSTAAGIYRWDGTEFRHWAKDKITSWYNKIFASPDGDVFVRVTNNEVLYHLLPNEEAEVVLDADGKPLANVRDVVFTSDGRMWVARPDALFYRNRQGGWQQLPLEDLATNPIAKLSLGFNGILYLVTTNRILEIADDNSIHTLIKLDLPDSGFLANVIAHPDGSLYYMEKYPMYGRVMRLRNGQLTELISMKTNLHLFALRGDTIWAMSDTHLFAFRSGQEPEIMRNGIDMPSGSNNFLLVDQEESLWVCSRKGLIQFPEPETVMWTTRDGLPEPMFIRLIKNEEGIWAHEWGYKTYLFEKRKAGWQANTSPTIPDWLSVDGKGTIWGHSYNGFFYRRAEGQFIKLTPPAHSDVYQWSRAPDGTDWIEATDGLWRTTLDGSPPRFFANPLGQGVELTGVFEDSKGRLWILSNEKICQTSAAAVISGQSPTCTCETLNDSRVISRLVEMSDGTLWSGSETGGVWRYTGANWEQLPGYLNFPSKNVYLETSPSGGAWVYGESMPVRAISRPDLPEGWQVVERVSNWQGVPQERAEAMLEDTDGSLWFGTPSGLVRMPATVRNQQMRPPPARLVDLVMNGERVDLNAALQVPPGQNQVEIHFAALTYRDRSLLKFQYRLHEGDQWANATNSDSVFRFFNLSAGQYTIEVRASLDGVNWSQQTARITFAVLPHWYLRWWAITLFVLLTASLLYSIYRIRVGMLLGLERQRTRIAMDLHDEVGSGLGSIGILSSVAASTHLNEMQRLQLSQQIAETASELGNSLTDIVWSLKTDAGTLEDLAYRLTKRANQLFANHRSLFKTDFPEPFPQVNLSLSLRRNIFLIALEALHNAAKHANAEQVTLSLESSGQKWLLRVEDDGCGLYKSKGNGKGTGLGLSNMRKRAREIGGEINWSSINGHGTVVSLNFNPQAKER